MASQGFRWTWPNEVAGFWDRPTGANWDCLRALSELSEIKTELKRTEWKTHACCVYVQIAGWLKPTLTVILSRTSSTVSQYSRNISYHTEEFQFPFILSDVSFTPFRTIWIFIYNSCVLPDLIRVAGKERRHKRKGKSFLSIHHLPRALLFNAPHSKN